MNNTQKASVAIILACATKRTVKRKRWVKTWLKMRAEHSHLTLLKEILQTDAEDYKNYFRMSNNTFNKLLAMVKPFIERQNTNMRECITAEERLAVTLRYLATGRYFEDLKFTAIMSPRVISEAVIETCEVMVYVLQDYVKFPTSAEEWTNIAHGFESIYNFYNTVGALDGKHIAIKKPAHSGSMYFNYKGFYSIVLLALVNANKEFIMIDVGMNGKISDGGVLFYSKFGSLMEKQAFSQLLPQPTSLPNTDDLYPYIVIADEAFALHKHLMKPYSQRGLTPAKQHFNNRLSAARSAVENAFEVLASRFGVFQKPISLEPAKATTITQAACHLHNFLAKEKNGQAYFNVPEGTEKQQLLGLHSTRTRNTASDAKEIREQFCRYYNSEAKNN